MFVFFIVKIGAIVGATVGLKYKGRGYCDGQRISLLISLLYRILVRVGASIVCMQWLYRCFLLNSRGLASII